MKLNEDSEKHCARYSDLEYKAIIQDLSDRVGYLSERYDKLIEYVEKVHNVEVRLKNSEFEMKKMKEKL